MAEHGGFGGGADANLEGALEGELFAEGEFDAGTDALGGKVPQHGGVFVGDAGDAGGLAGFELRQGLGFAVRPVGGDGAVKSGDGVTVGVEVGMAKFGGDAFFKAFGDEVFEALGFLVDLVPGVAEDLVEKGFEQAMVADDLESAFFAGL